MGRRAYSFILDLSLRSSNVISPFFVLVPFTELDPDFVLPLWNKTIADLLEQKLESYVTQYSPINFPKDNYEITIINKGKLLIANAKSDLSIYFEKGTYSVDPSFSVPFGYDINNFCS